MWNIKQKVSSFLRERHLKIKWGVPPLEIWALNTAIAEFVVKRIKIFKENSYSSLYIDEDGNLVDLIEDPSKRKEKVEEMYDSMIYAFSTCLEENFHKVHDEEKYVKGMKIFSNNFKCLWY